MKPNTPKNIEFISEHTQNVLDRNPHWILRYGISSIFIFLVAILIGSYFIKYTEKKEFEIIITENSQKLNKTVNDTGKINYPKVIEHKKIKNGDTFNFIGKIKIPYTYFYKVKKHQDVLIKLTNHSNNKQHNIQSKINSVYSVPYYDYCIAEVYLSSKSLKPFKKEITYTKKLKGTALFSIDESRLLLKIFYPLKSLLKKMQLHPL